MKTVVFIFFILLSTSKICTADFGCIGYSTCNIGDDIQSIAAQQFLPSNSLCVDRDSIGDISHEAKLHVILNGWYMYKNSCLNNRSHQKGYSWPPASSIDPLLISVHFTKSFIPRVLSRKNIRYLIEHGPVGARDYFTLNVLQSNGVPSYFSGCLTLTLSNSTTEREDVVYAVDVDEEIVSFIRSRTTYPVVVLTHEISRDLSLNSEGRLEYAKELLEKYKKARCVITSRLHAAMPCLAFETPVLLVNTQEDQYRFDGLRDLVRNCDRLSLLNGHIDFDLNSPKENPKAYLPIRERLIDIVTTWVEDKSDK